MKPDPFTAVWDMLRSLRAQAANNAWANRRLLEACGRLSPAELAAPRQSFFPSIISTLNHILVVDWFYVGALEGWPDAKAAFASELPFAVIAELATAQRAVDRRLYDFVDGLALDRLDAIVDLPRDGWLQREPAGRVLLHLFQHQVHHRGQVHAMLAGTTVPPPQLDEFFLDDEAATRAAELAELGLEDAAVWR